MPHNTLNSFLLIRHAPSIVNCFASELAIANRSAVHVTRKRHRVFDSTVTEALTSNTSRDDDSQQVPWLLGNVLPGLNSVSMFLRIKQRLAKSCFVLSLFVTVLAEAITLNRTLAMLFSFFSIPVTEVCDWQCI